MKSQEHNPQRTDRMYQCIDCHMIIAIKCLVLRVHVIPDSLNTERIGLTVLSISKIPRIERTANKLQDRDEKQAKRFPDIVGEGGKGHATPHSRDVVVIVAFVVNINLQVYEHILHAPIS